MADPIRGKVLVVKVSTGAAGEEVKFVNLSRTTSPFKVVLNSALEAAVNTANSGVAWQSGDVIQCQVYGRINSSVQKSLTGGGVNFGTISTSADTDTPTVNL